MIITGFRTRNTTYRLSLNNRLVWGGKIGSKPRQYYNARVIVGCPAVFYFCDGGMMQTSSVTEYVYE